MPNGKNMIINSVAVLIKKTLQNEYILKLVNISLKDKNILVETLMLKLVCLIMQ